jgi:ComEC/Rec2-related protein
LKDNEYSYIVDYSSGDFSLYDYVCLNGEVLEIDDLFYRDYFNRKNIFYEIKVYEITLIKKSNFLFRFSSNLRNKIKKILKESFDYDKYSIIAGIFLGEKEELKSRLKNAIINSGVMHLLVASGSNISYIVLFIANAFWFLNKGGLMLRIISLFFAFVYALMIGLDPPITRAFIMLFFVFIVGMIERNTDIVQILFLTAFFMLLNNPLLIYDVSFIMSFISVYGIIFGYGNYGKFLYISRLTIFKGSNKLAANINEGIRYLLNSLISLFIVTFFAQLSLIPVLLKFFYKISTISFFSNVMLIPVSIVIMISTMFFIVIYFIFGSSFFFQDLLSFFAGVFIKLSYYFSSFKYSSVYLFYPNNIAFISSVIVIFFILNLTLLKNFYSLRSFFAVSFLVFLISLGWVKRTNDFFSFSANNVSGYLILKDGKSYLINPVILPDKIYSFLFSHGYKRIDFILIGSFKGYRKWIVDEISARFNSKVYLPIWFGEKDGIFGGERVEIFDVRFREPYGYFNKYSELIFCDGDKCYKS